MIRQLLTQKKIKVDSNVKKQDLTGPLRIAKDLPKILKDKDP